MEIRAQFKGLDRLNRLETLFPGIIGEELDRAMGEAVLVAEGEIAARTPVDTGRLRASIATNVRRLPNGREGRVFVQQVPYAVPVEEGSKPHVIEARSGRALRFRVGGKVIFRRRVQHPGSKGVHMFRDGAQAATSRIEAIFEGALRRAVVRISRGR
jgi:hypothetical protein